MGDSWYPFWEEAIQNTFWGMLSSFIKPMGILLAGCSSCRQVGISRDSNGRMGRTRWKSPCTFTSARAPRKKRSEERRVGKEGEAEVGTTEERKKEKTTR